MFLSNSSEPCEILFRPEISFRPRLKVASSEEDGFPTGSARPQVARLDEQVIQTAGRESGLLSLWRG